MKLLYYLLFALGVLCVSNSYAQVKDGNQKFRTRAVSFENKIIGNGFLGEMQPSSLTLYTKQDIELGRDPSIDLQIEEIKKLKFNNRTGFLQGFLIGAGIGVTFGLVSGPGEECPLFYGQCTPISAGTKAVRFGALGGLFGGIVGTFTGSWDIKLNGSLKTYEQRKGEMHKYLY